METKITATELGKSLSDFLSRVRYRRERFLIMQEGEPVAALAPTGHGPRVTQGELSDAVRDVSPVDEDFASDLERVQSSQPPVGPPLWR